jgi:phosphoglucomutase
VETGILVKPSQTSTNDLLLHYIVTKKGQLLLNIMLVSARSAELAKKWAQDDPNPTTAQHLRNLLDRTEQQDEAAIAEIHSLFPEDNRRISFGTAGLRAAMSPGPLGMNDLTVIQTAQGLARYCLQHHDASTGKPCAVVGYDHRRNPDLQISSVSFAILTALVFDEAGIDCILLDGFVLTPLVPFALQKVGAVAGIMVTASHNPKVDDGYKVYASDGCQIRAPMDKEIAAEIMKNLDPWKDYGKEMQELRQKTENDPCLGLSQPDTTRKMLDAYFAALLSSGLKTGIATAEKATSSSSSIDPPNFAYTAMHGIGHPFAQRVFQEFGLPPFKAVPSQKDPNFEFPTVPFPNPEEKGALDLAKKFATENSCDIVLANDPDADRLAVAEKDRSSSGEWTVFSGDQIGVMLGHWIWSEVGKNCGKVRSRTRIRHSPRYELLRFIDL